MFIRCSSWVTIANKTSWVRRIVHQIALFWILRRSMMDYGNVETGIVTPTLSLKSFFPFDRQWTHVLLCNDFSNVWCNFLVNLTISPVFAFTTYFACAFQVPQPFSYASVLLRHFLPNNKWTRNVKEKIVKKQEISAQLVLTFGFLNAVNGLPCNTLKTNLIRVSDCEPFQGKKHIHIMRIGIE